MKELGIASKRWEEETDLKFVFISLLLGPLSIEDINNIANNEEPNLYSDTNKWKGKKWATKKLKELRASEHAIKHLGKWRSSLNRLTGLVMSRPDQVREVNVLFDVFLHCSEFSLIYLMTCSVQWFCGQKIGVCWECG
jgi:hypothetical protein